MSDESSTAPELFISPWGNSLTASQGERRPWWCGTGAGNVDRFTFVLKFPWVWKISWKRAKHNPFFYNGKYDLEWILFELIIKCALFCTQLCSDILFFDKTAELVYANWCNKSLVGNPACSNEHGQLEHVLCKIPRASFPCVLFCAESGLGALQPLPSPLLQSILRASQYCSHLQVCTNLVLINLFWLMYWKLQRRK